MPRKIALNKFRHCSHSWVLDLEAEAEESLKRLFSIMVPVLLILLGCLVAYTMISAMTARLEGIP